MYKPGTVALCNQTLKMCLDGKKHLLYTMYQVRNLQTLYSSVYSSGDLSKKVEHHICYPEVTGLIIVQDKISPPDIECNGHLPLTADSLTLIIWD